MAETGDIIIMNTTGKRDPFNSSSQNVPDHIAKAVGKAKNITGSMKSTRSTRSLGGISIFMDPETAASLPRDLEMTMSMYEVEKDPALTNGDAGDAGPSTEYKKETGHVEVNGDIYATVVKTKTTTSTKTTKDGSMVNGETDDAKSFVFTSELAGENKRDSRSAHGSGQVVQTEGAPQTETKGTEGKKSSAELEHVSIEREESTAVANSTNGSPFTAEQSRTGSIKESGSKRQEKRSDKIGSGATGGFEAQATTTTNNNNNTAGPNNKNAATDVKRAGSFQLKSAYSGDTQRMVSSPSSNSLHDTEFKNSLSDTLIRKAQKGRIDQQQAPSSVSTSSQSVSGAGVGVAATTTTPVAKKEEQEKEQIVKTDNKSTSVTKRETTVEKTTTTSSGQSGVVTRQKEVNRTSSSSSRPVSQSGSRQSLSKNVYGVFGKGAKDASKPVARASSSSSRGGATAKSGAVITTSSKRESLQSQSSSSVAAAASAAAAAAAAAGVNRKESTKSEISSTAANVQQVSRSASKASSRAEDRPVTQTPSVTSKTSTTVTTVQQVSSSSEESKKAGVEKAASPPAVQPSRQKEVVQQVSRSSSKASSKIDVQPLTEKSFSKVEVQRSLTETQSPKADVHSFTENSGSATTSTSSLHVAETPTSKTSLQALNTSLKSPPTTTTVSRVTEVERSSSKASDATSSIRPVSLVSSVSSVSTLQHSDSQRSVGLTQANKGKYYKSEPGKSYGSTTSLQRSISQRSDSAKISEPISTSSSISSLARRYSSKEIKPGDSSTNVSTLTDVTLPSRADSEVTLQESPDVETEATVTTTTTTTTTIRKPEAEKSATHSGAKETGLKTESMTTTKTTSSDQPSPSVLQNKAFKAEISALFAGRPAETTASAPTSLARNKEKKKQQLYSFDSDQDIRLTANYRGLSKASGDPDAADTEYDSQTFPRSSENKDSKIVSSTPTSPIYEIKQTVQSGTVGKLVKDVFWNLPLTGRSLDATLERKNKAKESKQPGEVSPKASEEGEAGDGKKKYRFMVEGIDVPAPEKEEEEKRTETTQQSSTTAELQADKPDGSTEQAEEPQSGTLKKDFEKKGFSYILDKKLASEIVKRAETVTKKRPHEKVEEKVQVHRQSSMVDYESDLYKDAKAKLHKKETSVEVLSDDDDTQHESDFLKEIRSKLNKQRSTELVVEKTEEDQQTSHGQKNNQTEVHASVPPAPVNTEQAFSSETNAKKTEMKSKDLAKRSIVKPTTDMSRSHAKDAISTERTTAAQKSPLSPDSAYQSDPNLSPTMGTEIDAQPSTSFDKTAGSKSHKVTLEDLGPEPEDLVVQPVVLTDGSVHNGAATQFESSQQRLVRQTKTVTTTTTSDFDSPQGKKQLQETKTDWTAESSTVVKSGGKVHKDSSFKSESKEFRNFVGDGITGSSDQPSRDSRAIGAKPQPLSQLDIINAALTSQSSNSTTPKYSETVAKPSVEDSERSNEFGATAVTQKESRGERRTKDVETKILIQDSAHYNSSLQADSGSSTKESGRSKKSSKGRRPERVYHSVGKDAPPEIVVDTVETPRDFNHTQHFSPSTSNHYSHSSTHSTRTPGPEPPSASPSASPLNRSYHEVSADQDVYRGQNNNGRRRPGTDSHAAKIIQLEPLAVDVNYDSHFEMNTHPSVENLNVSPLPQRSGRNGAYNVSASSTPYGPLSPQSDASGSVWLNSPYPTMSSTAKQSTYTKEYREINNNETYRYDVGIENIPSPKKFLKVDELSSGKVPKYASRDIQIHDVTNRQQMTTRSAPYPNGMDSLDSGGIGSNDRRGNYQVHKVMQQRMGREVYSQPIDMHPDMQYKKQKFYSISQDSGGGPSHAGRIPSTSLPGGMNTGTGTGYSDTLRSVEIDAVDPELENASTDGSNYHITLKLNPHGQGTTSRPASKASYYAGDNLEENRYSSSSQAFLNSPTGPGRPGSGNYPSNQRQIRVLSSSSAGSADYNNYNNYNNQGQGQGQGQGHTHYVMMNVQEGPGFARGGGGAQFTGDRVDGYSSGAEMYGTGTSGLSANSTGGPPPRYTMAIDQTMTMDYVPKEHEQAQSPPPPPLQPVEPGRHKANIYLADSRKVETNTYFEPEPTPLQTSTVYVSGDDEPDLTRRHRMTKMSSERTQHDNGDLRQYMSPDEDVDYETDDEDMPQVVRGSILIKNTMDTTGAPKVIDVVEGEDSEEEFVVEDNTNPFHGKYFQLRENPMYNSDPDLSQMRDETDYVYHKKNKPEFTKIFEKKTKRVANGAPEDEGTEISVTKESNKGPRKHRTKRTEHHVRSEYMNGHAGGDDEDELYSEGEYTTRTTTKKTVTTEVPRRGGRGGGVSSSSRGATGGGGGSGSLSVDMQIARLLQNAPPDSVKQTISVEREEEEILGPLSESPDDPNGLLNFDTVSEKVDLGLVEGKAQVAVKVRCERIVPIRGVEDMFKKSSVIVTRMIEIDLQATEERRRLYDRIMHGGQQGMITGGEGVKASKRGGKLSSTETFNLYKTFMGLADAEEGRKKERMQVDRKIEEQQAAEVYAQQDIRRADVDDTLPDYDEADYDTDVLDQRLEDEIMARKSNKAPDLDTISYMSALSEASDLLY